MIIFILQKWKSKHREVKLLAPSPPARKHQSWDLHQACGYKESPKTHGNQGCFHGKKIE